MKTWKQFMSSAAKAQFGSYIEVSLLHKLDKKAIRLALEVLARSIGEGLAEAGYKPSKKTLQLIAREAGGGSFLDPVNQRSTLGVKLEACFTADPRGFLLQLSREADRLRVHNAELQTWEGFIKNQREKLQSEIMREGKDLP